jgi:hypothetical protein
LAVEVFAAEALETEALELDALEPDALAPVAFTVDAVGVEGLVELKVLAPEVFNLGVAVEPCMVATLVVSTTFLVEDLGFEACALEP